MHRRKFEVVFVSKKSGTETEDTTTTSGVYSAPPPEYYPSSSPLSNTFKECWLRIDENPATSAASATGVKEIEEDIIDELVRRHSLWISS